MNDEEGDERQGNGRSEGRDGFRRGGMNPNYFLPKPVKVGDEVEV